MAEWGSARSLGSLDFNTREPDEYFIKSIDGEDGIPVRAPIDMVPHGDGGIIHDFWDEPRHITVKGVITLDPALSGFDQIVQRNTMEDALIAACYAIRRSSTTWSRSRSGMGDQSLSVYCDMQPVFSDEGDGRNFTFGLVAANPVWS